jgi:O-methyltransferase involved in polyketide biosynthesis
VSIRTYYSNANQICPGTYVRTTAIDRLVDDFLISVPKTSRQIISLGSGSDTRFFRLKNKYPDLSLIYHEFDFPTNTAAKIRQMQMPPFVQSVTTLCNIDLQSASTRSSKDDAQNESLHLQTGESEYHLHPLDLRTLVRPQRGRGQLEQDFTKWEISLHVPTLLLSECCLIYLPPEDADSVLSYFTQGFESLTSVGVIIYEPIRPHDAFGRTMVSNLTARGIHLQTLNAHDTLKAQKERLRKHGFGGIAARETAEAEAADVDFIWQEWIDEKEKERVEALEWMDEVEEWRLLARHYCVAWAWREAFDHVNNSVFSKWTQLPVQDEEG